MTPDPPATAGSSRSGSGSWPAGFRGIGGDLIRPPARGGPTAPARPAAMTTHGAHLLSPIRAGEDGARMAACPVCLAEAPVPAADGWVPIRCSACGTKFVASDGSPPPALEVSAKSSPIAPPSPLDPLEPSPDVPHSFTSDVRKGADGHRRVSCPLCRRAEVDIPRRATVGIVLRCPLCRGSFLVGLGATSPAARGEPPAGRSEFATCPSCSRSEIPVPDTSAPAVTLRCPGCHRLFVLGLSAAGGTPAYPLKAPRGGFLSPLPSPSPPPSPSLWGRIRRWFRGG